MASALTLPRLVFGAGAIATLPEELAALGVSRPLLISDRGLERAGVLAKVQAEGSVFLDVPENPTVAGADAALAAYRAGSCDGVVALGGGSVLDTAKFVVALAADPSLSADDLLGRPDRITGAVPLVAISTTVGTGSDSSPVSGLHRTASEAALGTRHTLLVPRVAICDPDLARSLPRHLIAATGIDALSHCIEGFFAEPAHPVIDALALDGATRVFADIHAALEPDGDEARASLMAAAYQGGVAIHKGLGPAHAIALACGDQHVHHGTIIAVVLPRTTRLLARHLPAKAERLRHALRLPLDADLGQALESLIASVGLPASLTAAGYQPGPMEPLLAMTVGSHFNRSSPYVPSADEYRGILEEALA